MANGSPGAMIPSDDAAISVSALPTEGVVGFFETGRRRAVFPGLLAWIITSLPIVLSPARTLLLRGIAVLSLLALCIGIYFEEKRQRSANVFLCWAFPGLSAIAWCVVGYRPGVPDTVSGLVGCAAWGMFALAAISPVARRAPLELLSESERTESALGRRHRRIAFAISSVALVLVSLLGWGFLERERSVFRFITGGTSAIALLYATDLVLQESGVFRKAAAPRSRRKRLQFVLATVLAVAFLGGVFLVVFR